MNVARLICKCPKCGGYAQPISTWLTDRKELLITAVCINDETKFDCTFPLAECFKACPAPDLRKALQASLAPAPKELSEDDLTAQDKAFCHELRIRFTAP